MRDFEKFLRQRHPEANVPRFVLFHEHIVRLAQKAGVLKDETIWVNDSTPMWCYGAVTDTVRLVGEGIQKLTRLWADGTRQSFEKLARHWDVDFVLAPSIKGAFGIDWKDKDAQNELITQLANRAVDLVDKVRRGIQTCRRGKRKKILKLCRHLMTVVEQNLEATPEGNLTVAERVATGRLLSLEDPQARHGRKSNSRRFNGFKLHVLGDAISGLIVSLAVTPGNFHDRTPALRLIRRAKQLCASIEVVLGDTAYGSVALCVDAQRLCGVEIIAPPPAGGEESAALGKAAFDIDLQRGISICPNGQISDDIRYVKPAINGRRAPRFIWPKDGCVDCPFIAKCKAVKDTGNPRIRFHPLEEQLRERRAQWEKPETKRQYKKRSQGERLINEAVRRGARKAMAWGLGSAELQAYIIVMVNNLTLLARRLADKDVAHDVFASAA